MADAWRRRDRNRQPPLRPGPRGSDLAAPALLASTLHAPTSALGVIEGIGDGLAVGALAAPQGSVATIIAADLAGPTTPPLTTRRLAPLAIAALLAAMLLLKASL